MMYSINDELQLIVMFQHYSVVIGGAIRESFEGFELYHTTIFLLFVCRFLSFLQIVTVAANVRFTPRFAFASL